MRRKTVRNVETEVTDPYNLGVCSRLHTVNHLFMLHAPVHLFIHTKRTFNKLLQEQITNPNRFNLFCGKRTNLKVTLYMRDGNSFNIHQLQYHLWCSSCSHDKSQKLKKDLQILSKTINYAYKLKKKYFNK